MVLRSTSSLPHCSHPLRLKRAKSSKYGPGEHASINIVNLVRLSGKLALFRPDGRVVHICRLRGIKPNRDRVSLHLLAEFFPHMPIFWEARSGQRRTGAKNFVHCESCQMRFVKSLPSSIVTTPKSFLSAAVVVCVEAGRVAELQLLLRARWLYATVRRAKFRQASGVRLDHLQSKAEVLGCCQIPI